MDKQSPSPLKLWILRLDMIIAGRTGWRSMTDPPLSATVDLIMWLQVIVMVLMAVITVETLVAISAPPSLAPSPVPPPSQSSSDLIPMGLEVDSWRLYAVQHMLPQI